MVDSILSAINIKTLDLKCKSNVLFPVEKITISKAKLTAK